jgi:hypothetical protein
VRGFSLIAEYMSFDLNDVKDRAASALSANNVDEARGVYTAAILDVTIDNKQYTLRCSNMN